MNGLLERADTQGQEALPLPRLIPGHIPLLEGRPYPTVAPPGQPDVAPTQGKGKDKGRKKRRADSRKRRHNRQALEEWLRHYNNRFPSGGTEGLINLQALPKPSPEFGPLDRAANLRRVSDADLWASDKKLAAVLLELKNYRWHLFMALSHAYLDASASPSVVDEWRGRIDLPARLQLGYHNDAVEWLLDRLDEDDFTLVVELPDRARSDFQADQKAERGRRSRYYWSLRDAGVPPGQAAKRTAAEFKCALSTVYDTVGQKPDAPEDSSD